MKAISKPEAKAGFELIETPKPTPEKDEVLIKVSHASVCGTDFHITNWDAWSAARIKPPLIYGHEFCGVIESVGKGVKNLKPGDYVSAEMHWFCGKCPQCTLGHFHICEKGKIYGVDANGCFADYVVLPAQQIVKLPSEIPPEYGACLDSLGNAVHAVSKTDVKDQIVYVSGCGPIGLFAIAVSKAMGAKAVYASDISDYRLKLAKKAGADHVLKADQLSVSQGLLAKTEQHGVDVVLEMSGNPNAIHEAFSALKQAGVMVLMGIPKGPIDLDINRHIIFKESKVIGVNGREIFGTWEMMIDLLSGQKGYQKLDLDFIITHRLKLEQFGEAMDLIAQGKSGKIILEP
ncbi:MAG: L-threonine 3-dehydrogenase [Vampirovibrionales bacterium]|nr:L-threonine 3-dehydrogenase [Vampirovibrionales bacterium]